MSPEEALNQLKQLIRQYSFQYDQYERIRICFEAIEEALKPKQ